MSALGSQHGIYKRTENSNLSEKIENIKVDNSVPVNDDNSLPVKVDKSLPVPSVKARTFGEGRRLLKGYVFEDIMNMKPIRYLENFKNPCWMGTEDNGPIHDNKIHCLPYYYLLGVKKSGTSDLFHRITQHPDVASNQFKELQWFPHRRFLIDRFYMSSEQKKVLSGYDPRELSYYIHMFDIQTQYIMSARTGGGNKTSYTITGEGTPGNLNLLGVWEQLPGNEVLSEPRYTNIHYIKHLIPQAKIIITFRNPVERLYSDFLMDSKMKDATLFHQHAAFVVEMYENCFKNHSFRHCIYNHNLTDMYPVKFEPTCGFYAFFMKEINSVFPPNQILTILFDDYAAKPFDTLSNVYSFLGLRNLNSVQMKNIMGGQIHMSGADRRSRVGPMLDKTRKMLNGFYRSSNEEMAKLMGDKRYLFSEE